MQLRTHITCGVVCKVQTAIRLFSEVLDDALALWEVLGIDKVGCFSVRNLSPALPQISPVGERSSNDLNSLAPNFFAHSSFFGLVSIAKILLHFLARAPWRMERPTQPIPKTATVEPSSTMSVTLHRLIFWGTSSDQLLVGFTYRFQESWSERRNL